MPKTNKMEAVVVSERLRQAVEKYDFQLTGAGDKKNITISIGIANMPEDADSKDSLIVYADKALYKAKSEGKNRIVG